MWDHPTSSSVGSNETEERALSTAVAINFNQAQNLSGITFLHDLKCSLNQVTEKRLKRLWNTKKYTKKTHTGELYTKLYTTIQQNCFSCFRLSCPSNFQFSGRNRHSLPRWGCLWRIRSGAQGACLLRRPDGAVCLTMATGWKMLEKPWKRKGKPRVFSLKDQKNRTLRYFLRLPSMC